MVTAQEIWKKAKRKNPPPIREKDYLTIAIAGAVSAVTSVLLAGINVIKSPITHNPLVDFIIYALGLSSLVVGVIYLFFKVIEYWRTVWTFISLYWNYRWKKKEI